MNPACRYCGHSWLVPEGVNAGVSYCDRCAEKRREEAKQKFDSDDVITVRLRKVVTRVPSSILKDSKDSSPS